MAAPKDFSADGAVGAGGPGMSRAPGMTPPSVASTPPAPQSAAPSASLDFAGSGGGGGLSLPSEQTAPSAGGGAAPSSGPPTAASKFPSFQTGMPPGGGQGSNVPQTTGGIFFDQGGEVPDDNGQSQQQQDPMSAILQRSMGSVDQVLQQMYKNYGLQGGPTQGIPADQVQDQQDNGAAGSWRQPVQGNQPTQYDPQDSNPSQEAANMPAVPASQSNSGVPPQRPGPGTLPPTSNPFGKRADAGGIQDDGDADDQGSA